jgi:glycosyltransferase involved in cell wall biosynthesis
MERGVPITLHRSPTTKLHDPDDGECHEFLRLYDDILSRFRPDVLATYGGNRMICEALARARSRGIATMFSLHNFSYHSMLPFTNVDAVRVPSQYAADHYRRTLGLRCTVLPNLFDYERVFVEKLDPRFVTLVNPSIEKGVYVFAKIADELGRRRPDIPLLAVEARGTEETLADCGLDLRVHGNVHLMSHTFEPRMFWQVSRICLVPSLWRETLGRVAVEAMINGIPVIASDRGALPETLGQAGIILPLPERLTPSTRFLPTVAEVEPWVEAIIRLWDDASFYEDHRHKALAEARRWAPDVLEPRYVQFFNGLRPRPVSQS